MSESFENCPRKIIHSVDDEICLRGDPEFVSCEEYGRDMVSEKDEIGALIRMVENPSLLAGGIWGAKVIVLVRYFWK